MQILRVFLISSISSLGVNAPANHYSNSAFCESDFPLLPHKSMDQVISVVARMWPLKFPNDRIPASSISNPSYLTCMYVVTTLNKTRFPALTLAPFIDRQED